MGGRDGAAAAARAPVSLPFWLGAMRPQRRRRRASERKVGNWGGEGRRPLPSARSLWDSQPHAWHLNARGGACAGGGRYGLSLSTREKLTPALSLSTKTQAATRPALRITTRRAVLVRAGEGEGDAPAPVATPGAELEVRRS